MCVLTRQLTLTCFDTPETVLDFAALKQIFLIALHRFSF